MLYIIHIWRFKSQTSNLLGSSQTSAAMCVLVFCNMCGYYKIVATHSQLWSGILFCFGFGGGASPVVPYAGSFSRPYQLEPPVLGEGPRRGPAPRSLVPRSSLASSRESMQSGASRAGPRLFQVFGRFYHCNIITHDYLLFKKCNLFCTGKLINSYR